MDHALENGAENEITTFWFPLKIYSKQQNLMNNLKLMWQLCFILSDVVIEQANWDASKAREKLQRDIDAHVASIRAAKLSELTTSYEVHMSFLK